MTHVTMSWCSGTDASGEALGPGRQGIREPAVGEAMWPGVMMGGHRPAVTESKLPVANPCEKP